MRQELVEAGGDKMILSALAEGKSVQEIAQESPGRGQLLPNTPRCRSLSLDTPQKGVSRVAESL
jgi:hypothetical protein